jgi:hypothetical protein
MDTTSAASGAYLSRCAVTNAGTKIRLSSNSALIVEKARAAWKGLRAMPGDPPWILLYPEIPGVEGA